MHFAVHHQESRRLFAALQPPATAVVESSIEDSVSL